MWRRDACQGSPIFSNSAYWFLRIWVILLSAKCSLPRPLDPALAIANRFMKLAGAVWRGPWSHRPADHLYASWQLGNFRRTGGQCSFPFIFSEIYLAERNEDQAVPTEVGRYGGHRSKLGDEFVMGGCSAIESASSTP